MREYLFSFYFIKFIINPLHSFIYYIYLSKFHPYIFNSAPCFYLSQSINQSIAHLSNAIVSSVHQSWCLSRPLAYFAWRNANLFSVRRTAKHLATFRCWAADCWWSMCPLAAGIVCHRTAHSYSRPIALWTCRSCQWRSALHSRHWGAAWRISLSSIVHLGSDRWAYPQTFDGSLSPYPRVYEWCHSERADVPQCASRWNR